MSICANNPGAGAYADLHRGRLLRTAQRRDERDTCIRAERAPGRAGESARDGNRTSPYRQARLQIQRPRIAPVVTGADARDGRMDLLARVTEPRSSSTRPNPLTPVMTSA